MQLHIYGALSNNDSLGNAISNMNKIYYICKESETIFPMVPEFQHYDSEIIIDLIGI